MKKTLITLALSSLTFCSGCFTTSVNYSQPEIRKVYIKSNPERINQLIVFEEYRNPIERVEIIQHRAHKEIVNPALKYNNTIIITPKPNYAPEPKPNRNYHGPRQYQHKRR